MVFKEFWFVADLSANICYMYFSKLEYSVSSEIKLTEFD